MILPIATDTIGASLIYIYQTNHTITSVNLLLLRHGENCSELHVELSQAEEQKLN